MYMKKVVRWFAAFMVAIVALMPVLSMEASAADAEYSYDDMFKYSIIKGEQGAMDNSAYGGIDHTLVNVFLDSYIYAPDSRMATRGNAAQYEFEGETFYFSRSLPGGIVQANQEDMSVSVVFLLRKKVSSGGDSSFIIDADSRVNGYLYYAPNADLSTYGGRAVRAYWHYLMELLISSGAHIDNFILGNEVNMPNQWHYSGSPDGSGDAYNCATKYADAFYQMYSAVRKYTNISRCSVSVDHSWQNNNEGKGIGAKDFLDLFNARLAQYESNVEWCVSTHLYPARLYDTRIWVDPHNLAPRDSSARIVDGNNLFIMTNYIRDNFGSEHRVMLTEQGFTDNYGAEVQAACLAYTYYMAKYDPMVDSFLISSENVGTVIDEDGEQSMNFDISGTLAEEVYTRIDSGKEEDRAWIDSVCLPVIGISSWEEVIPYYGQEKYIPTDEEIASVKAFVERMYTVALGRGAESAGIVYWSDVLLQHTSDGAAIANGFIMSPEFIEKGYTNEEFIKVLYNTFLDREFDDNGLSYWLQKISEGSSREAVLAGFVNSPEFDGICTEYGISRGTYVPQVGKIATGVYDFVGRCYTHALERSGDEGGINYWVQKLVYKLVTPEDIAKSFFMSPEYTEKGTTDEEYIKSLYRTFMGREAEESGLQYWKNELANGVGRDVILQGFAYSPEFETILESYGL